MRQIGRGATGLAPSHVYALKAYKGRDADRNFERETQAFMNITGAGSKITPGMIGFYQSFQYCNTFNILLEYADNETLEKFFELTPKPAESYEVLQFWTSLFQTVKGICTLHGSHFPADGQPSGGSRGDGGTSLQGSVDRE